MTRIFRLFPCALLFLLWLPCGAGADGGTRYYGVYLKDAKLGSMTLRQEMRTWRDGRRVLWTQSRLRMDLTLMGTPNTIETDSVSWSDPKTGAPILTESRNAASGRVTLVRARYTNRTLEYSAQVQGTTKKGSFTLKPGETFLADFAGGGARPQVGIKRRGKIFVSDTLQLVDSEIEVAARTPLSFGGATVSALKVLDKNPLSPATLYLAPDGSLLRAEVALGIQIRRESRTSALASAEAPDLTTLIGARQLGVALENPRRLRHAVYEIGGVTRPLPLDNNVQTTMRVERPEDPVTAPREKNERTVRVTVRTEPLPNEAGAPLFARPEEAPAALRAYLRPTLYVPSDHPEFQELARKVLEGGTETAVAAARIAAYVHRAIETDSSIATVRTALDVLRDPRGVCRDYTTLFAAIARAAGLPTKQCVGLVYANGQFLYHAWPEVWVGTNTATGKERWVALEPTWGEAFADATHIKLSEGEITDVFTVAADMGRYRIKVLEAR